MHDVSLSQNLRAIDVELNTVAFNPVQTNLSPEQFTRVRLLEGLVALTRRFIDNADIPVDDAAVRVA